MKRVVDIFNGVAMPEKLTSEQFGRHLIQEEQQRDYPIYILQH
jgi:hypothetical protein